MSDFELTLAQEQVRLLPERALFRPRDATLFVADVHLGKAATFRAHGLPIPDGTTHDTLTRLSSAIDRCCATRLVVLGDLLHARAGRHPRTEDQLIAWRLNYLDLQIELIRGNHDRQAGDPDPALDIILRDPPVVDGAFELRHHPAIGTEGYALAGHLHPGVSLIGPSRQRLFLPCFHFAPRGGILPAFGEFTGLAATVPKMGDRVFAIAGDDVIEVRDDRLRHTAV